MSERQKGGKLDGGQQCKLAGNGEHEKSVNSELLINYIDNDETNPFAKKMGRESTYSFTCKKPQWETAKSINDHFLKNGKQEYSISTSTGNDAKSSSPSPR